MCSVLDRSYDVLGGRILVHSEVRQPVGVLVLFAPHVLEGDVADFGDQMARLAIERNQSFVLDPVDAEHLLHEQQRIRLDVQRVWPCASAHSSAASRPRYSATLLVATPMPS